MLESLFDQCSPKREREGGRERERERERRDRASSKCFINRCERS